MFASGCFLEVLTALHVPAPQYAIRQPVMPCRGTVFSTVKSSYVGTCTRSAIFSHCSAVGSMPVGLCAQPAVDSTPMPSASRALS